MKSPSEPLAPPYRCRDTSDLISEFHALYYHGPDNKKLYATTTWLGVRTLKCPLDLWIYQEILASTRPEVIVETGVRHGGSTLYLASICDLLGTGKIVACDITLRHVAASVRSHPRIKLLEGSSVDPEVHSAIAGESCGRRTMVILDSDHSYAHVLGELRLFAPLVTPGCYLICEDTNVNGHPVCADHGPGPFEAVTEFLSGSDGWRVDTNCERLLVTFNPSGYLLREK